MSDLDLMLTIPEDLNRRIHALPHGAETLGDKILRLLEGGVVEAERQAAEDAFRKYLRDWKLGGI